MLRTVLVVGLLAGLAAGLATAVLQHFTTVPLILAAEAYETAAADGVALAAHGDDAPAAVPGHAHGAAAWSPADGIERTLATSVATVVSAIGFSLVLMAAMLLAGERITPARALAFAAAGFAATGLATGLGLAPVLPGSAAGPVLDRQVWWFATAIATAGGLYLMLRVRTAVALAAGAILVALPHLVGAPQAEGYASLVPAELAAHFASTSLVVHAAFWAMVGVATGWLWQRLAPAGA